MEKLSLSFLRWIYYITLAFCSVVGMFATSAVVSFFAGAAFFCVWMVRVVVDGMCTSHH